MNVYVHTQIRTYIYICLILYFDEFPSKEDVGYTDLADISKQLQELELLRGAHFVLLYINSEAAHADVQIHRIWNL